jgi:hypothetical protein
METAEMRTQRIHDELRLTLMVLGVAALLISLTAVKASTPESLAGSWKAEFPSDPVYTEILELTRDGHANAQFYLHGSKALSSACDGGWRFRRNRTKSGSLDQALSVGGANTHSGRICGFELVVRSLSPDKFVAEGHDWPYPNGLVTFYRASH